MKRSRVCSHHSRGTTLIEVLVVIFIISVIGGGIYTLQNDVFRLNKNLSGALNAHDDARQTLRKFTAELRTASQSSRGAPAIAQAESTSITFYANIDTDTLVERVRYFLDGTTLKRGVIKPSGSPLSYDDTASETFVELVDGIANGTTNIFTYYDSSYDGTTNVTPLAFPVARQNVRLIKIELLIDREPAREPGPTVFTTQVTPRNL